MEGSYHSAAKLAKRKLAAVRGLRARSRLAAWVAWLSISVLNPESRRNGWPVGVGRPEVARSPGFGQRPTPRLNPLGNRTWMRKHPGNGATPRSRWPQLFTRPSHEVKNFSGLAVPHFSPARLFWRIRDLASRLPMSNVVAKPEQANCRWDPERLRRASRHGGKWKMFGVYEVVMAVLLLFPWLLVSTVGVGAMRAKVASVARSRRERARPGRRTMPRVLHRRPLEVRSGESA